MVEIDVRHYGVRFLHLRQITFCLLITLCFHSLIFSQTTDQNKKTRKKIYVIHTDTSKPSAEDNFEVHEKHIDIQYMLSGCEVLGYSPQSTLTTIKKPYDDVMDVTLYKKPNNYSELIFSEGMFVLLYPNDGHMFKCQLLKPLTVRRVIVKILV